MGGFAYILWLTMKIILKSIDIIQRVCYNKYTVKEYLTSKQGKCRKEKEMGLTRLELLTFLYSLQVLLESGNEEKAKEIIEKVIKEAEREK